ncbi:hypothetical protein Tco_0562228 [Tanacetum coccineum]
MGRGLVRASDRRYESTSFSDSSTTLPPLVPRKAPPQLAPLLNLLISSSSKYSSLALDDLSLDHLETKL